MNDSQKKDMGSVSKKGPTLAMYNFNLYGHLPILADFHKRWPGAQNTRF